MKTVFKNKEANKIIRCDICGMTGTHNLRCPNYIPPKAMCYCSICGEGIYPGEEYIQNDNEEYRHYDCFYTNCFYTIKDLLEWVGHKIKIMEE